MSGLKALEFVAFFLGFFHPEILPYEKPQNEQKARHAQGWYEDVICHLVTPFIPNQCAWLELVPFMGVLRSKLHARLASTEILPAPATVSAR